MSYSLDGCSCYKKLEMGNVPIYIFEKHNMSLPVWGTYANRLKSAMHLITFDSHTDTQCAFFHFFKELGKTCDYDYKKIINTPEIKQWLLGKRLQRNNFEFEDVLIYANSIYNTEQILTAVVLGYICSYTVRCHFLKEVLIAQFEEHDCSYGYDATYIGDDDNRKPVVKEPLILDIDLDYFRSKEELGYEFKQYIKPYYNRAKVVTIARETAFFECGRKDKDFTVDEAENRLLALMNELAYEKTKR